MKKKTIKDLIREKDFNTLLNIDKIRGGLHGDDGGAPPDNFFK